MTRHWNQSRRIKSKIRRYKNIDQPSSQYHFEPETLLPLPILQCHHRGRGGDSAHNEDYRHNDEAGSTTDLDYNVINDTSLNNLLGRLYLFLSAKSVLVTMPEESRHILRLRYKYHAKAEGRFLFSIYLPTFLFVFEALLTRGPKPVSNINSVNLGLHGTLACIGHGREMHLHPHITPQTPLVMAPP